MASWFLPVNESGHGFGSADGVFFDVAPGTTVGQAGGLLRVWDVPERCEGWRWPARLVEVAPVDGATRFWSPHTGESSAVVVVSVTDGMGLWGPNGRGVLAFVKRAGSVVDEEATTVAGAWLRIPRAARYSTSEALRKTIQNSGRGGASVAARALAIDAFDSRPHQLGRRVAEPVRASIRAAASCVVIRDVVKDARTGLTQKGFDLLTTAWQT